MPVTGEWIVRFKADMGDFDKGFASSLKKG